MGFSKSVSLISLFSFANVFAALVNTLVVASLFGVSREVEIFFAASQIFSVILALSQTGQLTEAFIPEFHRIKFDAGITKAYSAASVIVNWMVILGAGIALVVGFSADWVSGVVVPGFSDSQQSVVASYVILLCPLIVINIATTFFKAICHAEKIYGWPEGVTAAGTAVQLLVLLLFYRQGVIALVYALVVGSLLQFFCVTAILYRKGYRHSARLAVEHFSATFIFRRLLSTSVYVLGAQGAGIAMTSALSVLPQGVYGAYNYALKMHGKIGTVLLRPISIVFFTNYSSAFSEGRRKLGELADQALNSVLLIVAFSVALMFGAADYFMVALLKSDVFPVDKIYLTRDFLTIFVLSLFLAGFGQIARKMVVSMGRFDAQYYLLAAAQFASAVFILAVIPALEVPGIYLSIAFQTLLPPLLTGALLYFTAREHFVFYRLAVLAKWLVSLVVVMGIVLFARSYLHEAEVYSRMENIVAGAAVATLTVVVGLVAARFFGIREVQAIFARLGKRGTA